MHLVEQILTGVKHKAVEGPPFGPGFSEEIAEQASKMEVWGTGIKDPGPDYCEFRLIDDGGQQIAAKRVGGY